MTEVPTNLRLVLPSPNGSALAFRAATGGATVVAGCLRNATAVGTWLQATGKSVLVVPAGERWPNGSLRLAVEDLIGAGAILRILHRQSSPEARQAIGAFEAAKTDLLATLVHASSGRELDERGFRRDVDLAAELDVSDTIPILQGKYLSVYRAPRRNPVGAGRGKPSLDPYRPLASLAVMTATAFLDLKQRASKLSESERRNLSAYLIRLGQERAGWKKETARRLNEMADGKKVSVASLRKQLGHA